MSLISIGVDRLSTVAARFQNTFPKSSVYGMTSDSADYCDFLLFEWSSTSIHNYNRLLKVLLFFLYQMNGTIHFPLTAIFLPLKFRITFSKSFLFADSHLTVQLLIYLTFSGVFNSNLFKIKHDS
jgi:hypothetical protein